MKMHPSKFMGFYPAFMDISWAHYKGFYCESPKQKGKKKENVEGGKKGSGKKSLLNAAEIGEALVQLLYLGIRKNIEIKKLRKIDGDNKK